MVAQAAHGTVAVNANGTYAYTPVANYNGPDSFTFKASDGTLDSNVATVTLTVTAVNDAPVAANGAGSGSENTPITGTLSASDIEGAALTYSRVAQAAHGSVTVNPDGTYSYTPNAGYYGPDSFTFKANDGGLDSNVATVNLTVTEKSDPPTDIDLSVTNVNEFAANDTVVGSLTTLDPDGADTFTYSLLDDAGGRFAIDGSNLVVANYILLDYEQHASHTILVRSTDASGLVVDKELTIAVNDINPELVTGTTDDDHVVGGALADTINGGDGHDHLVGGGGGDQLNGNDGNDFIEAGEGNDTVFGGIGDDRIDSGGGRRQRFRRGRQRHRHGEWRQRYRRHGNRRRRPADRRLQRLFGRHRDGRQFYRQRPRLERTLSGGPGRRAVHRRRALRHQRIIRRGHHPHGQQQRPCVARRRQRHRGYRHGRGATRRRHSARMAGWPTSRR